MHGLTRQLKKVLTLPSQNRSFQNVGDESPFPILCKSTLMPDPTEFLPTDLGWVKDESSKSLTPLSVAPEVELAPSEVLKMNKCGWQLRMPAPRQGVAVQLHNWYYAIYFITLKY